MVFNVYVLFMFYISFVNCPGHPEKGYCKNLDIVLVTVMFFLHCEVFLTSWQIFWKALNPVLIYSPLLPNDVILGNFYFCDFIWRITTTKNRSMQQIMQSIQMCFEKNYIVSSM